MPICAHADGGDLDAITRRLTGNQEDVGKVALATYLDELVSSKSRGTHYN